MQAIPELSLFILKHKAKTHFEF